MNREPDRDTGWSGLESGLEYGGALPGDNALESGGLPAGECVYGAIGGLAYQALLREAETTPKPGLVDLNNSGAHKDMDIRLFRISAAAIAPYLTRFARLGAEEAGETLHTRLPGIRPLGMEAEGAMFAATRGVNTHKGAIFTMGILTYLAGRQTALREPLAPEGICALAKELCAGVERELVTGRSGTKGERAYRAYGVTGIRGEAAAGFPSVLRVALPCLRLPGLMENLRLCHGLVHLMAKVEDTNVLSRGGPAGAAYVKAAAQSFLEAHDPKDRGYLEALAELDRDFIERGLSPGGSADLLAAAWFLDSLGGL